jgi:hypothetical protein
MGAVAPTKQDGTRTIIFTKFTHMKFITNIPMFWRRFLPPSSGLSKYCALMAVTNKTASSTETLVHITTRHVIMLDKTYLYENRWKVPYISLSESCSET